jgi:hypothetical protein
MKKTFSVRNWEQFQHYKDRLPPWIKLHNQLLDDYEFEMLGDSAKGHLLCIWMLASRTNNKMPFDDKWVAKKIGASTKVNLNSLVSAGFLIVEQDASNMLQSSEQDDTVSVPLEEKRREENNNGIIANAFSFIWNAFPSERRTNKKGCFVKFEKVCSKMEKQDIEELTNKIASHIKATLSKVENIKFMPTSQTYFNQERWNDQ